MKTNMDGLIKSSAISLTPKKQTRSSNLTLTLWFNLHPYIIWEIVYGIKWNTTWVRIKNCNKYGSVHCSYLKHPLLQLHIVASQVLLLQYVCMCVFVCVKAKKSLFTPKKTTKSSVSAQHARSHARKMQWIHPANLSPHKAHSTLVLYMCYYKKYCTCAVMHSNTFTPYLVNSVCCGSLYGNKALTGFAVLQAELSNKAGSTDMLAQEVQMHVK